MRNGWVDPDSLRLNDPEEIGDEHTVSADFYAAEDGRRTILRMPLKQADRLDTLLLAQLEHGVLAFDQNADNLHVTVSVNGHVRAENQTSGPVKLRDGLRLTGDFPSGTFEDTGIYEFQGTGSVDSGVLFLFAARVHPVPDPIPGLSL